MSSTLLRAKFIFDNKVELKNFAYEGTSRLEEDRVKEAVGRYLCLNGYEVAIGKKHERGPDLRAERKGTKLIVEAKGEGTRNEMFNNFFLAALGGTLQRMDIGIGEYGIALPAHRKFVRLVDQLPDIARNIIRLNFYLVRVTGKDEYEVGELRWNTR